MDNEKFDKLKNILKNGWRMDLYEYESVLSVYKLKTSEGLMSLKRLRGKAERLSFIKQGQDYLYQNGFRNMSALVTTSEGLSYYRDNKDTYILTPWIEGLVPTYKSVNHIQMMAYTLADLHNKSMGFKPLSSKFKIKYDKWPKKVFKKERELKLYVDLAKATNKKFDKLFLKHADWLIARTKEACEILTSSSYERVADAARVGYLCHGDIAIRNCVVNNNEIIFIDFDSMSQDLPVVDLWRLLRRSLRRNKWCPEFVNAIIIAYEYNRKLSNDEKQILFALLTFPERAWRIAHRYYEKKNKSDWHAEGYYKELAEFMDDRDEMDKFIIDF